jgi:hypothetical protein
MLDVERPFLYPLPRFVKNLRLKEWRAFHFGDERWFFFSALYDAKLASLATFHAYDRETKKHFGIQRIVPGSIFSFGESLSGSRIAYRGSRTFIEFQSELDKGFAQIAVLSNSRNQKRRFSGRFRFAWVDKSSASESVCLPLGMNRAMYSTKTFMPLEGEFSAGGETRRITGSSAMGVFDDHKGYYPWRMRYDWVSGFGLDPKGRRIAFNLTDNQVRDQVKFNENCLWINNRVWPLPPVRVTRPHGAEGEWVIQDTEGMVDLIFVPELRNDIRFRLGVIDADYHGPFGAFRGVIKNGEGEKLLADSLYGAGEQKYLRA